MFDRLADDEQKLRYKDFRLMGKDEVLEGRLDVEPGRVVELTSMKEFAASLEKDPVIEVSLCFLPSFQKWSCTWRVLSLD